MENPILFSGPMVRALLNTKPGTWPAEPIDPDKPFKSMTRRVIKPQPDRDDPCIEYCNAEGYQCFPEAAGEIWAQTEEGESIELKPRYKAGDILWVREQHRRMDFDDSINEIQIQYAADGTCVCIIFTMERFDRFKAYDGLKWRPSIFLPREAARIFLEVKNVRIERIQEISYEDMEAEGISFEDNEDFNMAEHYQIGGSPIQGGSPERFAFASLWNTLNAKRGYSWDSNPWVWVYEFMRVK